MLDQSLNTRKRAVTFRTILQVCRWIAPFLLSFNTECYCFVDVHVRWEGDIAIILIFSRIHRHYKLPICGCARCLVHAPPTAIKVIQTVRIFTTLELRVNLRQTVGVFELGSPGDFRIWITQSVDWLLLHLPHFFHGGSDGVNMPIHILVLRKRVRSDPSISQLQSLKLCWTSIEVFSIARLHVSLR